MQTITVLATVCVLFTTWYFSQLPRHFRTARKIGLPVYFCPVNPADPAWLVIYSTIGYERLSRLVPRFIFDRIKLTISGWEFHARYDMIERLGKDFVLVTPGSVIVYITDPSLAVGVFKHAKEFGRNETAQKILGVFGQNLISSKYDDWKRQRRIVTPILNERIMELVWSESSTQTSDMLSSFTSPSNPHPGETNETFQGLKTITINVINRICFGAERSWNEEVAISPKPGFQLTFAKSIVTIVDNLFPSVFLSAKFMSLPFMPSYMRKIGRAKTEFPLYLKDTIDSERKSPTAKNTLITSLVKLADQDSNGKMGATYLREDEIGGNLFNFTIAGFDTTANTLSYSILALALFPEWQNWMIDGIDEVTKSCPDGDYATIFPLLTRVMAIMNETLRIYSPLTQVAREVFDPITINDIHFPAGCLTHTLISCIHVCPEHWAPSPFKFLPSRWISTSSTSQNETLYEPPPGTFLPFSGGPRFCPGKKMAQVEFVSVIYQVFKNYRVEILRKEGETEEQAKERIREVIEDSSHKLTMQVNRPEDGWVRWVRR